MPRPFCVLWPGTSPRETSGGQLQSSATDTGKEGKRKKKKKKKKGGGGGGGEKNEKCRSVREGIEGMEWIEGRRWTKGRRGMEWKKKRVTVQEH